MLPIKPVTVFGEVLLDIFPSKRGQDFNQATAWRPVPGGAAANVAVGLTRLGIPAALVSKVGDDPFGYKLAEVLQRERVDCSGLLFEPSANTGFSFGWVADSATGDTKYVPFRQMAAHRLLHHSELDLAKVENSSAVQFSSLLLATEPSISALRKALATAQAAGVPTFYDVNMRLPAWVNQNIARTGMLEPLESSTVVKLNRHELKFLTEQENIEAGAAQLWRPNMRLLVVTLESDGCFYFGQGGKLTGYVPAFEIKAADNVACGDAFMAALLRFILGKGWAKFDFENPALLTEACRFSNAAGALAATRHGALESLPTLGRLRRFLAQPPA